MSTYALDLVASQFADAIVERYTDRTGDPWAVIKPLWIRAVAKYLKDEPNLEFKMFISMDCVDRLLLPQSDPRFEVLYFFYSPKRNEHVRLKVRANEGEPVPSIASIYFAAAWGERFVWDFYGLTFDGNKDLRRILLYEEFKGHPLRKDYPLRGRQPLLPERPIQDLFRGPGTRGVS